MKQKEIKITGRCPIRTTLELVGGKWKLLILHQLAEEPLRFSQLKRAIPDISEKMLIQELKILVQSRLVHRQDFKQVPPKVQYSLTEKGRHALPLMAEMKKFADAYWEE
ncbi:MAG TPA: helix-turn-helix domain-containing protein [Saprospiraceae bacterium]|nr:helix-turn-helix domain-containing protein [Saprospiraceae bacterium]